MRAAILTEHEDFHAQVIRHELTQRSHDCWVIEVDGIAERGALSWDLDGAAPGVVAANSGSAVAVKDLDVVWCRRWRGPTRVPDYVVDLGARDIVERNSRAGLEGLFLTDFSGSWVSDPLATRTAELKLVQLREAKAAGLRLPRTLVSQDPSRVRAFCEELRYEVVVKALGASRIAPTMTGRVTPELLTEDAIRLCPAIYQELIGGHRHLRVCCFGQATHAAVLTSDRLDWRYPHDVEAEPGEVDEVTRQKLHQVLSRLGLRMGIFDLKLVPGGPPVWLELNPQGQFLFLEGLCGMPLIRLFSDFLIAEAFRPATAAAS